MRGRPARLGSSLLVLACALGACDVDTVPDGARATPDGDGPRIVFDLTRRPLPELPQPNDVATFADPTSRTGLRLNASTVAPTMLEARARADFGSLEGWGTFAPITVAFERDPRTPETEPALDLVDIETRTRGWDPSDDPFYVVDLTSGMPVPLDLGKGSFPLAVVRRDKYWPNDPRADEDSVVFETVEEGPGLGQRSYRPELDTDFDGVLDHPNVIRRTGVSAPISEVIDWYERESDTLLLRPVVPLEEMHEYAVVLTDRLRSASGSPVRSPFEHIHHAYQRRGAERVRQILSDAGARPYYGDVAGTGLERVAFVWTFTTQPVFDDMRRLRDGLHGRGPFARLATEFPPSSRAAVSVGLAIDPADEPASGVATDPRCAAARNQPFIMRPADAMLAVREVGSRALGVEGEELRQLEESLAHVSHFVVGTFESPYFLGDPKHEDPDGRFELDFKAGTGRVTRDTVPFLLAVPKATDAARAPFPVTTWSHGATLNAAEVLARAGYFARQGIAVMAIDMPGHGLALEPGLRTIAGSLLRNACLSPFIGALTRGRHEDLDGDGAADSGGLLWTAHMFHSRDNIRQSVVDQLQATRVLRSWDGTLRSDQDYDGDGAADLAGDFDGDGVPDVGGPTVPITTAGNSYGGIVSMIHGAVDPNVVATAAISGGGGLSDIAVRSELVTDSVLGQAFTPLVVAIPPPKEGTQCAADQRSVRLVVNDLTTSRQLEVACLSAAELAEGRTVILENVANHERRCARTGGGGRFRIPVPADAGDRLDVQVYDARDAVTSYGTCELQAGAPPGRRIQTFELAARYRDQSFEAGSPLVSPQAGLGLRRQSPEARRLFALSQVGVEAGDPINFAPYYALRAAPGIDGAPHPPRAVLAIGTAGDPYVPIATSYAFARAAGAVPFLPTPFVYTHPAWAAYATPRDLFASLGDRTPHDVLVETGTLEGLARLRRTRSGPACLPNYVPREACTSPPAAAACDEALFDVDWLSEGRNLWDAPRLAVPLRLARAADVAIVGPGSLVDAWAPRLDGAPFDRDDAAWTGWTPLVSAMNAWTRPRGEHVFVNPDPCRAFDDVLYYDGLFVRFLASQGRDLVFLRTPSSHHCLVREDCSFYE